ncbi:MAG: ASPIC/UnbV domain-containing protein, partial [Thiohalocapsa sp.]|nr:ASPIC/UnbV domain-containing protein [Thiohalocapsa sp.]
RNLGNANRWVQLDLQGTVSNRDGVGARVFATAGGVGQIRWQDGGYHRWSQHHQRLHFGLGANTVVDLRVEWPSGNSDTFFGVAANRLYRVIEGAVSGEGQLVDLSGGGGCDLPSASLFNISTRARAGGGGATMIGGFVVRGDRPKRVLIRARGPSLADSGVTGAMGDPTLRLFSGATQIDFNDNWRDSDRAAEISATGRAPQSDAEAAIIATLAPGAYTAHVTDATGAAGIAIVEALGVDEEADVRLFNVSTRASVETGDGVTIGGFVIRGSGSKRVLVRGRGPSLASSGLTGTLRDPTLEIFSGGTSVAFNDDWRDDARAAEVAATGRAPENNREAALLLDLGPGAYTAILRGDEGASGIGIIEVIAVDEDSCP